MNGRTKDWGNTYGYDAWGNLLQKTPTKCSAENLSVTALANNQLSGYSYDAAGNITHDATTGNNYLFDVENRIVGAAGYTYTYDADGNRVEKSNGSTGTIYWYMSPGIIAESDLSGNLTSEYVFFNGKRMARRDFSVGTTLLSYYFSDQLKTAHVVTDAAGNIEEDADFYPWGGELQFINNDSNKYKFSDKERDAETGLDYFGRRFYANTLARFTTPDPYRNSARPAEPQTWNRYAYVHNNPVAFADFEGLTDYYVFRPLYNSDGPTWTAIKAQAAKNGDKVTVYNGKKATAANFYKAMATKDARVVTTGHTVVDSSGHAHSLELKSVDGVDLPVGTLGEAGHAKVKVPAPDSSEVAAASLGAFSCSSSDLASQYPTVTFTGVTTYIEPDEEGATAYTSALVGGATFEQAGAAAQQAMQQSVAEDNQSRKEPTREKRQPVKFQSLAQIKQIVRVELCTRKRT